ncbi:MAG: hypothetical protein A2847_01015 [Candidatus Sungbacteria bacterium RIFCSPHIGHO2_01_FULL_50_25]|uniref:Protein kinase domain-containing protein n=1 Tax=Candidatus Sungbacteria bacterium RIFCSPHIGHO2_01_FULL_50_25 TaxID=1802265 RepID=A0A1G2KAC2_9BACT|nr:MAG: hypothetical protein A2847_01015 [Candidatus Sungbacteria bacterium RIFCSPHIGHO2_01_FULL_50_25]
MTPRLLRFAASQSADERSEEMYAYLGTRRIRLDPAKSKGKGCEADIFDIGNDTAVKIFKPPDHPDFDGVPAEQQAARERIRIHQTKLPALMKFSGKLPARVILPSELVRDDPNGALVGYAMPFIRNAEVLLRYGDRTFREAGVPNDQVRRIFLDLHQAVLGIHHSGIVIGDFNDLNVLVRGEETFVVDTDSCQFDPYLARMFTARFVDPMKIDPKARSIMLAKPYDEYSDWYAYAVMLWQSLLFVGPYGGVYRPKDPARRMPHDLRPLRRITVFHPEVLYPKPAVHFRVLSDDLLQYFHRVFERDERGDFPCSLLESLEWKRCSCGTVHARAVCPTCNTPGLVKETIRVKGNVSAEEILKTKGVILHAAYQRGKLLFLYYEDGRFKREDGTTVMQGELDPLMRFRASGARTLIGKGGRVATVAAHSQPEHLSVDTFGNLPLFDAIGERRFWVKGGRLMTDGPLGPEEIGAVLEDQTVFWAGEKFGFGFYRASNLSVAFVFEPHRNGINDSVRLPRFTGALIDSTAVFADERVWFFAALEERGKTAHRCFVIRRDGTLEAEADAFPGDGSWLSTIRGKSAVGKSLFVATDEGIVRLEVDAGAISVVRQFPDTEPFVDESTHLFVDPKGIYAVRKQTVTLLSIS